MSQEQYGREVDNENAMQLMPEIEWACRVLVSSILSPKYMTKRELIYSLDLDWISASTRNTILEEIKKEMRSVYDYSDSLYHIFRDCLFLKGSHPRLILPEAAVDRVINSGETLTMESLVNIFDTDGRTLKHAGFLGPRKKEGTRDFVTMESFRVASGISKPATTDEAFYIELAEQDPKEGEVRGSESNQPVIIPEITITDNIDALKLQSYLEAISEGAARELITRPKIDIDIEGMEWPEDEVATTESNGYVTKVEKAKNSGLTEDQFRKTVYKAAPNNIVTHLRIPGRGDLKRRSVGRPLVMSLPPGSVIPVHVPGDVRRQLGFILLLDETGHPVNPRNSQSIFQQAESVINTANSSGGMGNSSAGSMLLSKAARNLNANASVTTFSELTKIFAKLVDENITPRLMNGAFPGGAEIADTGDLYALMLARVLCSMRTRMVFVHVDMLTYFAFDYHDNGIGKSLLDSNKMLIAIRAGLLLTRMTGELRNAIPLTKVRLKIDEDDADWEKTWEEAQHALATTRQPSFPLNSLAVNDLMGWINRAGYTFEFEGHPRMPDTRMEFEQSNHENHLPDQEFYDSLGRQLYMGFGIPPELMDTTYDPEFAIAVASRNIMFTQTILEAQKTASGLITDDHHRLILSDGVIMNMLVGVVRRKWGEISSKLPKEERAAFKENPKRYAMDLVERIVRGIRVSLPAPDATTLENQYERFTQYDDFIDKVLPSFIGDAVVSSDIAPELAQKLSSMSDSIKAAFMRDFLANNNILPELFRLSSVDEEGRPQFNLLEILENYASGLNVNLMAFAKAMQPIENAVAEDTKTIGLGSDGSSSLGSGGGDYTSSGSDSTDGESGSGSGDTDGLGDLDFDIPA